MGEALPAPQTDYDIGFEAGLVQGYRAALAGHVTPMTGRKKLLAWGTLVVGLGGAGALLAARASKDDSLFNAFLVSGAVLTAIVGALQVLKDETSGPLGIR